MRVLDFVLARLSPSPASTSRPDPHRRVPVDRPAQGSGLAPVTRSAGRGLMVPAPALQRDEPHAGDPCLERWPVSFAEAQLAGACIAGLDRFVDLVEVCGSADRATAVLHRVRYEHRVAHVAVRAGLVPS